jgi:thiamine-monophosphate kinase
MQIKDWGEEGFVEYLRQRFPSSQNVGIGDDAAVIYQENGDALLVTTDALIEGIHFLKEEISPEDLGYKTLAVSLSDIAAMGGRPLYAFLTLALPKTTEEAWLKRVVEGLQKKCEQEGVLLLGGDTVGSRRDLFLSLTLIGSALRNQVKYRHTAQAGDLICVSDYLGSSGGGLAALQQKLPRTSSVDILVRAHFHPEPRWKEGEWLASREGIHAMMDVSDGLDCDLKRLLTASHCGASIELSSLPIHKALYEVAEVNGWDVLKFALTGGEDYCLLMTIDPQLFEGIQEQFETHFGHRLFPIGKILKSPLGVQYFMQGKPQILDIRTFSHF